jgi:murein DD-endopeptidase MepM/ murein hydrolase activator NlpD
MKRVIAITLVLVCAAFLLGGSTQEEKKDHIKWLDFNVSYEVLSRAHKAEPKLVPELLAYVALRNGNSFKNKANDMKNLNAAIKDRTLLDKYQDNKYYKYYLDGYRAILGGIIDFETGKLTGFHPIAKGFWYSCFDDFGMSRGYGYKRRHLGHDLFGSVGAPIIAVEGGTITELGWNRYGGWRIGIRSDPCHSEQSEESQVTTDISSNTNTYPARYHYYAHLRKDRPFAVNLQKGDRVTAGQVIGYLGNTGYSRKENVNMKQGKPHLHFGIQIIFHPSQEDGNGEIWIDCHTLCRFLSRNRAKVQKCEETKEWKNLKTQPQ